MKKITLFITSLAQGGAERQLLILGDQLVKYGYDVSLVTYSDAPDHYNHNTSIKRIKLAERKNKISKLFAIIRYFGKVDTEVVISYEEKNNFLVILGLYSRKKIRLLVSERNYIVNNGFLMRILRKLLYKRANAIIPNSYSQGQFLKSLGKDIRRKVYAIINYTDVDRYCPVKICEIKDPLRICVFARYNPQKNYVRLANAVAILKKKTKIKFTIDWFGKNIDAKGSFIKYFLEFKDIVKTLGLEDIIHLNGSTKKVDKLLKQYDAFLLPSLYEGFSNALSEAISSGLPCVVGDVSDNRIMVADNVNGFLFDPHDEYSISEALDKLQSSTAEQLNIFGQNSRKKAESLFDLNAFTQQYIKLL